jgi:hemerythrin-like domain-containing protein
MTTHQSQTLIDVHDMVVVHKAFRRELRIIPQLVRAVPAGDTMRATVVADHARLCLLGLHLHHTSEDELLWPKLLQRDPPDADLIYRMEGQHHTVEELVDRLGPAIDRWVAEARPAVSEEVASTFDRLGTALLEHLDDEEAHILPIAARTITQAEWDELGEHGTSQMSPSQLPILFGMVLEDATPDERTLMMGVLPSPVRLLMRTYGAWRYRRYVRSVRGAV